jgi:hypothetical protein
MTERPAGLRAFLHRVQPGDALIFIYAAAIARQYLCWVPVNNAIAWVLAAAIGLATSWWYVVTSEQERRKTSIAFWLLVVVPVSTAFLLRAAFPDVSFDVLNYRLFHGIRGLHGNLYLPGDFFPTPAPYNTAPDMAMGIFRLLFGYRAGTIINLFALLWSGSILDRLLRSHLANAWLRAAAVLLILGAEHLFFEINTYMIDLLSIPLLLEATRLALAEFPAGSRAPRLMRIAFLLGLSVAFKLINVVTALPIALLCGWRLLFESAGLLGWKEVSRITLGALLAFLVPVLPFTIYLYQEMGSPVFPIMNGIFKSPYWPPNSGWDNRWGGFGFWEVLIWPLKIFFRPDRLSELLVYSGRLSLGFIAVFAAWLIAWRDRPLRRISFLTLAGLLFWSAGTGYIRYALFLEMLAGLVLVLLAIDALKQPRLVPAALLALFSLGAQTLFACRFIGKTEWGGRPTVFQYPAAWKSEARYFFRDRSLRSFSPKVDRTRFGQVGVWIESSMKTAGLEILLNDKAPVIGLRSYESFASPQSRLRFVHALDAVAGKPMFSLCFVEDLDDALSTIAKRGLIAGTQTPLELPFYSPDYRLSLVLIEVSGAEQAAAAMRKTLSPL